MKRLSKRQQAAIQDYSLHLEQNREVGVQYSTLKQAIRDQVKDFRSN